MLPLQTISFCVRRSYANYSVPWNRCLMPTIYSCCKSLRDQSAKKRQDADIFFIGHKFDLIQHEEATTKTYST